MGKSYASVEKNTTVCKQCKCDFEQPKNKIYQKVYCTLACSTRAKRKGNEATTILVCENCNKEFEVAYIKRNRKFCSKSCANSGENNAQYGMKGELSPCYGRAPWIKGKTKFTDKRVAKMAQKMSDIVSQKVIDGEFNHPNGFKTGWFYSDKMNERLYHRSSYELIAFKMLESDENVISYNDSPLRIPYEYNGAWHMYIPDILIEYNDRDNKVLVEIKPENVLKRDSKVKAKIQAGNEYCKNNNLVYEVWTEKELKL